MGLRLNIKIPLKTNRNQKYKISKFCLFFFFSKRALIAWCFEVDTEKTEIRLTYGDIGICAPPPPTSPNLKTDNTFVLHKLLT